VRAKSETPRNVKESEGTNPHTPKWALILGVGISMDSQFFKKKFQELKFIGLKKIILPLKIS
jgi:hypothetical protein